MIPVLSMSRRPVAVWVFTGLLACGSVEGQGPGTGTDDASPNVANGTGDDGAAFAFGDITSNQGSISERQGTYFRARGLEADGTNGAVRAGSETTGKAIGMNYIIKY